MPVSDSHLVKGRNVLFKVFLMKTATNHGVKQRLSCCFLKESIYFSLSLNQSNRAQDRSGYTFCSSSASFVVHITDLAWGYMATGRSAYRGKQ